MCRKLVALRRISNPQPPNWMELIYQIHCKNYDYFFQLYFVSCGRVVKHWSEKRKEDFYLPLSNKYKSQSLVVSTRRGVTITLPRQRKEYDEFNSRHFATKCTVIPNGCPKTVRAMEKSIRRIQVIIILSKRRNWRTSARRNRGHDDTEG